jgi:hypothetical protein
MSISPPYTASAAAGGSGLTVHHLVLLGILLSVTALILRWRILAVVVAVPTLILAGLDDLLSPTSHGGGAANAVGGTPGAGRSSPPLPTRTTIAAAPTRQHAGGVPWTIVGLVIAILFAIAVIICLAIIYRRSRWERRGWDDWEAPPDADPPPPPYPDLGPRAVRLAGGLGSPHARQACRRLVNLARAFLTSLTSDDGRTVVDPAAPGTAWFVEALITATEMITDRDAQPERITAAIDEAERRWTALQSHDAESTLEEWWNIPGDDVG